MPEKSPETYQIITYLWVLGLATFGGMVSYFKKLKQGKKWKITDFLVELTTAAFVGLMMFFLCQSIGLSATGSAALTGIAGHFSSKALTGFSRILDLALAKIGKT